MAAVGPEQDLKLLREDSAWCLLDGSPRTEWSWSDQFSPSTVQTPASGGLDRDGFVTVDLLHEVTLQLDST